MAYLDKKQRDQAQDALDLALLLLRKIFHRDLSPIASDALPALSITLSLAGYHGPMLPLR